MVTINSQVKSGPVAVKVLKKLSHISICESHLMNLSEGIGQELAEQRDQEAAQHEAGKLQPYVKEPPEVVAVATDGGRAYTREKDRGRGVHDGAWKETKIACLTTLSSQTHEADPHPELPSCFTDEANVGKLVREIKSIRNEGGGGRDPEASEPADGDVEKLLESLVLPASATENGVDPGDAKTASAAAEGAASQPETPPPQQPKAEKKDWRPKRKVRTSVSSFCNSDEFGPKVAAEAHRRGFFSASRRAFLGDGLKWNWTLQERWFPDFEPILDFVHPTTYVYESARVVAADATSAWLLCRRWLEACWQGRVSEVLSELRSWQALHPIADDEKLADDDGRTIVSKAVTYLTNNASRMDYPRYRQQGLPVTSSMVESLIKEINYRVKGSEKAWQRSGRGEWMLQVRNAVLCNDADRLSDFILSRPGCAYYRPSTSKSARQASTTAV
jgi:hypothetical protein